MTLAPALLPASGPDALTASVLALGDALDELRQAMRTDADARRRAVRAKARTGALKPGRVADPRPRAGGAAPDPAMPAGWVPDFLLEGLEPAPEATP